MQPDVNQDLFNQAVRDGDVDQILWLLKSDAVDVNFRDCTHDLETPMMKLCHADLRPRAQESFPSTTGAGSSLLPILDTVNSGALRVDQQDALGRTLAMHACISGNHDMLRFAAERGCDPTVADRKGKNLVHYLAMSGSDALVDLVLEHLDIGQALRTLDFQGYSPVDLARQKKHSALARKLSNALVSTKKEVHGSTFKGDNANDIAKTSGGHGPTPRQVAHHDFAEPSRPPLTRRTARMPVVYRTPIQDDDHSSGPDDCGPQYRRSTSPPTSSSSPATSAESGKQNSFVRSLSLRRSYIAKRSKENQQGGVTPRAEIPSQPFYPTLPSSADRLSKNSNEDPRFGSRAEHQDDALPRAMSKDADSGFSRHVICQMLPNKSPMHTTARASVDQRLREDVLMDSKIRFGIDANVSPSPRRRLEQILNTKQLGLFDYKDDTEGGVSIKSQQKAGVGATFEETVLISPLKQLQHYARHTHNSSEELVRGHRGGGQVTDRRTERRSSISLPDLRDMTGCLVTSADAKGHTQDLVPIRKSRITLEDLDRRDNIKSYGTCDENFAQHDDEDRTASSASDMSMDSNFEDEKPIKRH